MFRYLLTITICLVYGSILQMNLKLHLIHLLLYYMTNVRLQIFLKLKLVVIVIVVVIQFWTGYF